MGTKHFNRRILLFLGFGIGFILLLSGIALFIHTLSSDNWSFASIPLFLLVAGSVALLLIINKENDITIDYTNKEVRSSEIKFDGKATVCIPFDAIVDIFIYDSDQLKKEIKLKRYPSQVLVVEKKEDKAYIPLTFFDEATIRTLIEELQKVKERA